MDPGNLKRGTRERPEVYGHPDDVLMGFNKKRKVREVTSPSRSIDYRFPSPTPSIEVDMEVNTVSDVYNIPENYECMGVQNFEPVRPMI